MLEESPGAIIQITDETDPWFPALLVIDEVKNFGVQAGCITPMRNDGTEPCRIAYKRLNRGKYEVVGEAKVWTRDPEEDSCVAKMLEGDELRSALRAAADAKEKD